MSADRARRTVLVFAALTAVGLMAPEVDAATEERSGSTYFIPIDDGEVIPLADGKEVRFKGEGRSISMPDNQDGMIPALSMRCTGAGIWDNAGDAPTPTVGAQVCVGVDPDGDVLIMQTQTNPAGYRFVGGTGKYEKIQASGSNTGAVVNFPNQSGVSRFQGQASD